MTESVIAHIARWCASDHDFSPTARERARHAIADTVACILAGIDDPSTLAVRRAFAAAIGTDGGVAVAGGGTASPACAALVNGTAAHALDYDDNFRPAISHASAVLVPALLAVAEAERVGGRALIDAYLVGLEAQAAVGRGVQPVHYTLGWHSTSTVGCIGTAAAVAWLQGQDEAGIARAISTSVSMAAGVKGQFGTAIKPVHAGLAARNAVEAAELAKAGMVGRLDILEGPQGFAELFATDDAPGWRDVTGRIGRPHVIESDGVLPKRHPCCGSTHLVLDALLDHKRMHGFEAREVRQVETLVGIANARNLAYPDPRDAMQARFSMQYCVARALVQDRLTLADFTDEAVAATDIRRLLPLIGMTAYSAGQERAALPGRLPHRISVHLDDGRVLEALRHDAKGAITDPFSEEDRRAKFQDCAAPRLGAARAEALYVLLSSLDGQDDVAFVADALAAVQAKAG
ncbi:MmgE/PrpD family protein [Marinivivus vitaminiproducens]|uniref:MmgE/PrpD family protein n=1 Tax=Marinivivus vitaminiproducens TaxID=3035935 RepID=UPI0027A7F125|nr:MmgE/PrpD family protein [Geminicoccaceae bacterium SCSIO 64248]